MQAKGKYCAVGLGASKKSKSDPLFIRWDVSERLPYRQSDRVCTYAVFFFFFSCSFWGRLTRGSREGERLLETANCFVPFSRLLGGLSALSCLLYCCAQAHVFVAPSPRSKRSFGARGAFIRFVVAIVALALVESRQSEHSSRAALRKGHR